jgi:hypothetical protein
VPSRTEAALTPEQRGRRDALEREILLFRERKPELKEDDYYRELEKLLLKYAEFYRTDPPREPASRSSPE